jgi:hypothetical protein
MAIENEHHTAETRIRIDELQILLNLFGKRINISYPLYDFEFLAGKLDENGYQLKITCSESDFDKHLSRHGGHARELPSYADLRGGLLSSGVLRFNNMAQFENKLKSYHNLSKDVKFSLDTNLLYFRFLTNYGLLKPSEVVLVKTVGNEIKAKLNHKYSSEKLSALKKTARFQKQLLDELWNRRIKRSRKAAYIALWEYKYILDGIADELEEIRESKADSSDNDRIIVKTLAQLEREGHTFPILLTADDAVADLCNADGVEYFKFDLPHIIKVRSCTVKQLIGLIFNLAAVFGFIKVNSVFVFGEFRGKSSNNPDELKLEFIDKSLSSNFEQDLRICRRLMELGIER